MKESYQKRECEHQPLKDFCSKCGVILDNNKVTKYENN